HGPAPVAVQKGGGFHQGQQRTAGGCLAHAHGSVYHDQTFQIGFLPDRMQKHVPPCGGTCGVEQRTYSFSMTSRVSRAIISSSLVSMTRVRTRAPQAVISTTSE